MIYLRRKGVALVKTKKGILVVAGKNKIFTLPGGGAEKNESRKAAAIRELREETGLKTKSAKYLFTYKGKIWHSLKGKAVRNVGKIFFIKTYGKVKPGHEVKYVNYWKPGCNVGICDTTKSLIERYLKK